MAQRILTYYDIHLTCTYFQVNLQVHFLPRNDSSATVEQHQLVSVLCLIHQTSFFCASFSEQRSFHCRIRRHLPLSASLCDVRWLRRIPGLPCAASDPSFQQDAGSSDIRQGHEFSSA